MATRANLRLLKYIEESPELRRSIPELPNADARERAVSKNFLFPWTRSGRISKARFFLEDHLDSFVDFEEVPRIFFPPPARDESLREYQSLVNKVLPKTKKSYLEAMGNLRAFAALAFGRPVELLNRSTLKSSPRRALRDPLKLEDTHAAIVKLFEQQLNPLSREKDSYSPLHQILNLPRNGAPREIEEVNYAMVSELLKTSFGVRLKAMVLSNYAISQAHQGEENRSTTSTNYSVPKADYWIWSYGQSSPYRYGFLTAEELNSARIIRGQMEQGSVSPWAQLK